MSAVMDKLLPDWNAVSESLPAAGQRVDVGHALASKSYNCTGYVDEAGKWHCANGFVYPIGKQAMLTFEPTHWRPQPGEGEDGL